MRVIVTKSVLNGTVAAPPSKSLTHRALIVAALAKGTSVIRNSLLADDTRCTLDSLRAFGVKIDENGNEIVVRGTGGKIKAPQKPLALGNSGTSLRLLTAVAALAEGQTVLTGDKRLTERPIGDLLDGLKQMGVQTECLQKNGFAPVKVVGGGEIRGGKILVNGRVSSQFISALLLIAPFADHDVTIVVKNFTSRPYATMTMVLMDDFGANASNRENSFFVCPSNKYKAREYTVEGDYSSISYFLAGAAITKGDVRVNNLNPKSFQGDALMLTLLKKMGCQVEKSATSVRIVGTGTMHGIEIDMHDYPDIVQTVTVTAAVANGQTRINNIEHLKIKETDRIANTAKEMRKFGIRITNTNDSLTITGGEPQGTTVMTHNDHRMAMCFATLGLASKGKTVIENAEVVTKSYPEFFNDLEKLGAKMEVSI